MAEGTVHIKELVIPKVAVPKNKHNGLTSERAQGRSIIITQLHYEVWCFIADIGP